MSGFKIKLCFPTLLLSFYLISPVLAQPGAAKSGTATISGRVTIEGKPAPGIVVTLMGTDSGQEPRGVKEKTDAEGRFNFAGVMPGNYVITPRAYAHVLADHVRNTRDGKRILVMAGETVDGVSFNLVRGGVVTGRVTDEQGRPVVRGYISLLEKRGDGDGRFESITLPFPDIQETDDRGVYRLFGVPAGRYLVMVRMALTSDEGSARTFGS